MHDARQHLSPVWTHLTDMVVDRAEGAYLYDTDGHRWLDFTCGIGVTNTGHCHPKVVEAIREQAGKILHAQANIYYHQPMLQLAERLRAIMPDRLDTYFFSNSGAEAIEASIKLARHATGRTNVIVFQGPFHGRTVGTMSLTTSKTVYRTRYQPLMAGVFVAPFPYSYYYGWDDETTTAFCLREIERLLKSQTAPEETAAMLIEPVLGEGGYVVPPVAFMHGFRPAPERHRRLARPDGQMGTRHARRHIWRQRPGLRGSRRHARRAARGKAGREQRPDGSAADRRSARASGRVSGHRRRARPGPDGRHRV